MCNNSVVAARQPSPMPVGVESLSQATVNPQGVPSMLFDASNLPAQQPAPSGGGGGIGPDITGPLDDEKEILKIFGGRKPFDLLFD